jgi:hypothetical protein
MFDHFLRRRVGSAVSDLRMKGKNTKGDVEEIVMNDKKRDEEPECRNGNTRRMG